MIKLLTAPNVGMTFNQRVACYLKYLKWTSIKNDPSAAATPEVDAYNFPTIGDIAGVDANNKNVNRNEEQSTEATSVEDAYYSLTTAYKKGVDAYNKNRNDETSATDAPEVDAQNSLNKRGMPRKGTKHATRNNVGIDSTRAHKCKPISLNES